MPRGIRDLVASIFFGKKWTLRKSFRYISQEEDWSNATQKTQTTEKRVRLALCALDDQKKKKKSTIESKADFAEKGNCQKRVKRDANRRRKIRN